MTSLAKKLPLSELPRERLVRDGIDALSLQELLAILLGTGTQGKTVLILAQELLQHFGGMEGLLTASIDELTRIKGIGQAKAILLKAAFGIALRTAKEKWMPKQRLHTIHSLINLAHAEIGHLKKEALLVILRDARACHIHHETIGVGTLSQVLVHPREVFHLAVRYNASSLVVCHNHPSGDPTPSGADILLTKRLLECAKLMSIPLADHIIVTSQKEYTSMKDYLEV